MEPKLFQQSASIEYRSLSILVFDPDRESSSTVIEMLKACGHGAIALRQESSLCAIWHDLQFDVLVVDVGKGIDAEIEILRLLKAIQPDIGIIAISADLNRLLPGQVPYADAFLAKPFSLDSLTEAIRQIKELG